MRAVPAVAAVPLAMCIILMTTACTDAGSEDGRVTDEERAFIARVENCSEPLFTDQQKVVSSTSESTYGGGLVCAVPATDLARLTMSSYTNGPVAVAYVDVYDADHAYRIDGFHVGRNCLYIRARKNHPNPSSLSHLEAFVELKPVQTGAGCPPMDTAKAHPMNLRSGGEAEETDIPPVVRIDMNQPHGRRMLISLRCLPTTWCEISNHGGGPGQHGKGSKRRTIAGWYDSQFLSVPEDSVTKPTRLYAYIFPHDSLPAILTHQDYSDWRSVAVIDFLPDHDTPSTNRALEFYRERWGFAQNTKISVRDTIIMQLKSAGASGRFVAQYVINGVAGDPRHVDYHADSTSARHVLQQPGMLMEIGVPATRWAFSTAGEGAWVRCAVGCCSVTGEDPDAGPMIPTAMRRGT